MVVYKQLVFLKEKKVVAAVLVSIFVKLAKGLSNLTELFKSVLIWFIEKIRLTNGYESGIALSFRRANVDVGIFSQ